MSAGWCLRTPPPRSVDLGDAPVSRWVGRCYLLTHLPLSPSGIGRVTQPGSVGWFPYKPWMPQLAVTGLLGPMTGCQGRRAVGTAPLGCCAWLNGVVTRKPLPPPGCGAQRGATVLWAVPRSKTRGPHDSTYCGRSQGQRPQDRMTVLPRSVVVGIVPTGIKDLETTLTSMQDLLLLAVPRLDSRTLKPLFT